MRAHPLFHTGPLFLPSIKPVCGSFRTSTAAAQISVPEQHKHIQTAQSGAASFCFHITFDIVTFPLLCWHSLVSCWVGSGLKVSELMLREWRSPRLRLCLANSLTACYFSTKKEPMHMQYQSYPHFSEEKKNKLTNRNNKQSLVCVFNQELKCSIKAPVKIPLRKQWGLITMLIALKVFSSSKCSHKLWLRNQALTKWRIWLALYDPLIKQVMAVALL